MKIRNRIFTSALVALATIVLGNSSSRATATISAGDGSLILGFRESGSTTAYLVKLGTTASFASAAQGQTFQLSTFGNGGSGIGNIGADLSATYGNSWYNRSDLYWGVFGFSNTNNPSLFASQAEPTPGTQSTPYTGPTAADLTSRLNTKTAINSVVSWLNNQTSTANSDFAVVQAGVSGSASYFTQVATPSVTDFGTTSTWNSIEGNFGNGTAGTALDLYRLPNGNVNGGVISDLGVFSIDNSGAVSFTTVPEPSTYAMMAVGLGLLIVLQRSHRRLQRKPGN